MDSSTSPSPASADGATALAGQSAAKLPASDARDGALPTDLAAESPVQSPVQSPIESPVGPYGASHVESTLDLWGETPPAPVATWRSLLAQSARHTRNTAPLVLADMLTGGLCLLAAAKCLAALPGGALFVASDRLVYLLPVLGATLAMLGLYPGIGMSPIMELRKLSLATTSLVAAVVGIGMFSSLPMAPTLLFASLLWPLLLVALPLVRWAARSLLARCLWWGEPVLIFGGGPLAMRLHETLSRDTARGMRSLGIIDELHAYWRLADEPNNGAAIGEDRQTDGDRESDGYLGPPEIASEIAAKHGVQWAILAAPTPQAAWVDPAERLAVAAQTPQASLLKNEHTIRCLNRIPNRLMIGAIGLPSLWTQSRECGGAAAMHVSERLLMPWPRLVKRTMDLVLSLGVGVLVLPLLVLLGAMVAVTSRGPIFYAHERIGQDQRRFRVWKFRTMVQDADACLARCLEQDAALQHEWRQNHKLQHDPRITWIGRILRSTSLDELPQLWNVVRGDMSLVGPRPIIEGEIEKYQQRYRLYTRVRPGITGMWQISGRNSTTYQQRVELDSYYVRNWSPWLDAYILARTVRTVLLREGAY